MKNHEKHPNDYDPTPFFNDKGRQSLGRRLRAPFKINRRGEDTVFGLAYHRDVPELAELIADFFKVQKVDTILAARPSQLLEEVRVAIEGSHVDLFSSLDLTIPVFNEEESVETISLQARLPSDRTKQKSGRHSEQRDHFQDFVWVQELGHEAFGALKGWKPAKAVAFFAFYDRTKMPNVKYDLALVEMPDAIVAGGALEVNSELARVEFGSDEPGIMRIIDVKSITGGAHMIPELREVRDGRRRWWINSRIDFRSWNHINS